MEKLLKIILFLCLFSISSFGQSSLLKKSWVGENLNYFRIENEKAILQLNGYFNRYNYEIKDSLLILSRSGKNYPYRIVKLTKDTLILNDNFDFISSGFDRTFNITFLDSALLYDESLKFKKLYFSTMSPWPSAKRFELEIYSSGKIYFHGINNSNDLNGYYEGKLGEEEMKCLIDILKCAGLDYFPEQMGEVVMIDGTYVKFKFRYNKKKKDCEGYEPPYYSFKLYNYLYGCYKNANLKKSKNKFTLDK